MKAMIQLWQNGKWNNIDCVPAYQRGKALADAAAKHGGAFVRVVIVTASIARRVGF